MGFSPTAVITPNFTSASATPNDAERGTVLLLTIYSFFL